MPFFSKSLLIGLFFLCSCEDHFETPIDDVISIRFVKDGQSIDQLPGDGTSFVEIIVEVPNTDTNNTITLFTDNGSFSNGEKKIEAEAFRVNDSRNVKFIRERFIAPTSVGSSNIYAKVGEIFSEEKTFSFVDAPVTSIQTASSTLSIARAFSEEITFTSTLFSESGFASTGNGISVNFELNEMALENPDFVFDTAKSNSSGQIIFRYTPGGLTEEGNLTVNTVSISNPEIRNSLTIIVYEPEN